ncbi:MAG: RNA polymerase sigma-70 factor [Rikenellaceae bacterium]|nr:RNA polymerase sigma-70 factor [Rikenellaceae bacterium]
MKRKNDSHIPEPELLEKLRLGDVDSYRILFLRYYSRVTLFIRGMTGAAAEAEDIAQNIFLKLWLNRESLDPGQSLRNYLFVMARNQVFNHLRSLRTGATVLKAVGERESEHNPAPDSEVLLGETREIVGKAVEGMPEKRKEVFRLSRQEGLSNREIAEKTGLSVRTVDKHIELALKDIRKILVLLPLLVTVYFQ